MLPGVPDHGDCPSRPSQWLGAHAEIEGSLEAGPSTDSQSEQESWRETRRWGEGDGSKGCEEGKKEMMKLSPP